MLLLPGAGVLRALISDSSLSNTVSVFFYNEKKPNLINTALLAVLCGLKGLMWSSNLSADITPAADLTNTVSYVF